MFEAKQDETQTLLYSEPYSTATTLCFDPKRVIPTIGEQEEYNLPAEYEITPSLLSTWAKITHLGQSPQWWQQNKITSQVVVPLTLATIVTTSGYFASELFAITTQNIAIATIGLGFVGLLALIALLWYSKQWVTYQQDLPQIQKYVDHLIANTPEEIVKDLYGNLSQEWVNTFHLLLNRINLAEQQAILKTLYNQDTTPEKTQFIGFLTLGSAAQVVKTLELMPTDVAASVFIYLERFLTDEDKENKKNSAIIAHLLTPPANLLRHFLNNEEKSRLATITAILGKHSEPPQIKHLSRLVFGSLAEHKSTPPLTPIIQHLAPNYQEKLLEIYLSYLIQNINNNERKVAKKTIQLFTHKSLQEKLFLSTLNKKSSSELARLLWNIFLFSSTEEDHATLKKICSFLTTKNLKKFTNTVSLICTNQDLEEAHYFIYFLLTHSLTDFKKIMTQMSETHPNTFLTIYLSQESHQLPPITITQEIVFQLRFPSIPLGTTHPKPMQQLCKLIDQDLTKSKLYENKTREILTYKKEIKKAMGLVKKKTITTEKLQALTHYINLKTFSLFEKIIVIFDKNPLTSEENIRNLQALLLELLDKVSVNALEDTHAIIDKISDILQNATLSYQKNLYPSTRVIKKLFYYDCAKLPILFRKLVQLYPHKLGLLISLLLRLGDAQEAAKITAIITTPTEEKESSPQPLVTQQHSVDAPTDTSELSQIDRVLQSLAQTITVEQWVALATELNAVTSPTEAKKIQEAIIQWNPQLLLLHSQNECKQNSLIKKKETIGFFSTRKPAATSTAYQKAQTEPLPSLSSTTPSALSSTSTSNPCTLSPSSEFC